MHILPKSLIAVVLLGAIGYVGYVRNDVGAATDVVEVKWLIAHEPSSVYANSQKVFADTLAKESGGRMRLTVLHAADVGFAGPGDIPYRQTLSYLAQGTVHVSSVYTVAAAADDPALSVVSEPKRFATYDAAETFFNGQEGRVLLTSYTAQGSVVSLAFTYSGGFRVIASKKGPLSSLASLKGLTIATSGGKSAEDFLRSLGAEPVSLALESGGVDLASVDAVETTFARLSHVVGGASPFARHILESNHSLFSTMLVANSKFYASLSSQDQAALRAAAAAAAAVERQDAINLNAATKQQLIEDGSTITTL